MSRSPDKLNTVQNEALQAHLRECQACSGIHERLRQVEIRLGKEERLDVPVSIQESFSASVMARLEKKSTAPSRPIRRAIAWGAPAFAAAALLLAILFRSPQPEKAAEPALIASADIVIESAQVDGRDANVMIFTDKNPDITFVWME
jgi:hypothetical protein